MAVNTDYKLEYDMLCGANESALPVVIVAGGNSRRMDGVDKIKAEILSMPVIARTLVAFEKSSYISKIVVVTKEENFEYVKNICNRYSITKLFAVEKGGESRAISVLNGLNCLPGGTKTALVHDAARPLVSEDVIKRVVLADKKYVGVICSVPVTDTIKSVENDLVKKTLNRNELVSVQTPQRVDLSVYLPLLTEQKKIVNFTDDASFLEKSGYEVLNVLGDYRNIKITTKLDLIIAKSLLEDNLL